MGLSKEEELKAQMVEFVVERDKALRSNSKAEILTYYRKYGEKRLADRIESGAIPEENFWAGVHRARLTLPTFTEEEKQVSREWLRTHNFEVRGASSNGSS